jgi:hypothetical protein
VPIGEEREQTPDSLVIQDDPLVDTVSSGKSFIDDDHHVDV